MMSLISRLMISLIATVIVLGKLMAEDGLITEAMAGGQLTIVERDALEAQVAADPDNKSARLQLIGYYLTHRIPARGKHVLWVIQKFPASDLAGSPFCDLHVLTAAEDYLAGASLWKQHTSEADVSAEVLLNAASYFTLSDIVTAKELLRRGIQIYPADTRFMINLARILSREPAQVAESFALFEKGLTATTDEGERFYLLSDVAKSALDAGDLMKAKMYANALLDGATRIDDWNTGNAVHHGNLVLGRVALHEGDIKLACSYLLKAGQSKGSPQMNSFGPNMLLAKELLEKGERETVLAYMNSCGAFWKDARLDTWIKSIQANIIPDFGASLVY